MDKMFKVLNFFTIAVVIIFFVIGCIVALPKLIFKSQTTAPAISFKSDSTNAPVEEIKWLVYRPENGYSPYDYLHKGVYDNSAGNSIYVHLNLIREFDIVLIVKEVNTGEIIRNEYIRNESIFHLTGIPNGIYSLSCFYGNAWSDDFKFLNTNKGFTKNNGYQNS